MDTLIHYLAEYAQLTLDDVKRFIARQPRCAEQSDLDTYRTVAHLAAIHYPVEILHVLLDTWPNLLTSKDEEGANLLFNALCSGNSGVAYFLWQKSVNWFEHTNTGQSLFHAAVEGEQEKFLPLLYEYQSNLVNHPDENGLTPLHLAARLGYTKIALKLIELGADLAAKTQAQLNPLHLAAQKNKHQCFTNLWQAAKAQGWQVSHLIDIPRYGEDEYFRLAYFQHEELVQYIALHVSTFFRLNRQGLPTLHLAAYSNKPAIVALILDIAERNHISPNELLYEQSRDGISTDGTSYGRGVFNFAARNGKVEVMRYLLNLEPELYLLLSNRGLNALHEAAMGDQLPAFRYILEYHQQRGKEIKSLLVQRPKNMWRKNIINEAASGGQLDLIRYILELEPELYLTPGNMGYYPIHEAAKHDQLAVIQLFIEHHKQCNRDIKNLLDLVTPWGKNIFYLAAENNGRAVMHYLLNFDPTLYHRPNNNGYYPLHAAAENGQLETIKYFIQLHQQAGGDCYQLLITKTKDTAQETACHLAIKNIKDNKVKANIVRYLINQEPRILQEVAISTGTVFDTMLNINSVDTMALLLQLEAKYSPLLNAQRVSKLLAVLMEEKAIYSYRRIGYLNRWARIHVNSGLNSYLDASLPKPQTMLLNFYKELKYKSIIRAEVCYSLANMQPPEMIPKDIKIEAIAQECHRQLAILYLLIKHLIMDQRLGVDVMLEILKFHADFGGLAFSQVLAVVDKYFNLTTMPCALVKEVQLNKESVTLTEVMSVGTNSASFFHSAEDKQRLNFANRPAINGNLIVPL